MKNATPVPFSDLLKDQTSGNIKTLQSDYNKSGRFPIVDQGQKLIGGYTDEANRLCKTEPPAIVFGDHTKCLKYIDFPFCIGADGTKVLSLKREADLRFVFHFLNTVNLPESGYSRHFKYLKKIEVPLPPLNEQKRIAAILDQADALRRLRQNAIDRLNTLGQSIFYEMFGDPISNNHSWPTTSFSEICHINPTRKFLSTENYKVTFLPMSSVSADASISNEEERDLVEVKKGFTYFERADVLIAKITPCFENRKSTIVQGTMHQVGFGSTEFHVIRPNEQMLSDTILEIVRHPSFLEVAENHMTGSAGQKRVPTSFLKSFKVPILPIELQREFQTRKQNLQKSLEKAIEYRDKAELLFSSLQQRAFRGEL